MGNKVWYKTVLATEDQIVEVYPNEGFDGIVLEIEDLEDGIIGTTKFKRRLYLSKDEMDILVSKMQETMKYVLEEIKND